MKTENTPEHQDEIARLRSELDAARAEIARLRSPGGDQAGRGLFQSIFDFAGCGIALLDAEMHFLEVNPRFLDMLGQTPEALLGQHAAVTIHPDDRELSAVNVQGIIDGRQNGFHIHKRMLRSDGSQVWVDHVSRAVRNEEGALSGFVCIINDVSDRHQAETAVRESEKRLSRLVERLPVLIHAHDADGNYVFWNRECERVLGYRAEEIIGNPQAREMLFPDPEERRALEALRENPSASPTIEAETTAADGTKRTILWTRITGQPPMPGWVLWESGIDITDRHAAESALRASESEKKIILDTISECVLYQTPEKRILWANRAACEMASMSPEEVRGRRCFEVWHGYKKSCMTQPCPVEEALARREPVEAEVDGEGGKTWLVKGYPLLGHGGEPVGAIELARDITSRKRAEEEARKARDMAENATKMKDEFLANMSHELRSPLNGVLGMLDVLLDSRLDEEQRDCIETALQAGEGLLAIINDILDFSKLQADKIVLSRNEFNLHSTVRTVCNTFREQSRRKGLEVDYFFDDSVPERVVGDEGRIRQILFNLVGNSVKFTREGSVRVECYLLHKTSDPTRARLLFTITDTGIGIPSDQIDTIFDPFVQLNWAKHRKYEGTGLGLGIVKRLVTLMGGIITVESEVAGGTTIHFWINVGLVDDAQS